MASDISRLCTKFEGFLSRRVSKMTVKGSSKADLSPKPTDRTLMYHSTHVDSVTMDHGS